MIIDKLEFKNINSYGNNLNTLEFDTNGGLILYIIFNVYNHSLNIIFEAMYTMRAFASYGCIQRVSEDVDEIEKIEYDGVPEYDFEVFKSFISLNMNDFKNFISLSKEDKENLLNKLFNLNELLSLIVLI